MAFDLKKFEDDFISIAKEINENNYTYSNEILYTACGGVSILPLPENATREKIDKLSSVILLVGRAYAASPERRKGAKKVNDGMSTFFDSIAKNIVNNSRYAHWRNKVVTIAASTYEYDGGQSDYKLLEESKNCVIILNEMLREAIGKFDEKNGLDDEKNCISFCTKLLHFIVPHIFYIKDGISWQSIWSIYRQQSESTLEYKGKKVTIPKYEFGEALNGKDQYSELVVGKKEKVDDAEPQYWYHCRGCYNVSCVLKNIPLISQTKGFNGMPNIYSLPRLVDSVLLHIHH